MPAADTAPDLSKINIYDAIGLDRDASVDAIQQQLHDLKVGWSGKAARQGSLGDRARSSGGEVSSKGFHEPEALTQELKEVAPGPISQPPL